MATIKEVKEILKPFKRTAYLPKTKASKNKFSDGSKMGGYPYLRNDSDWPVCPNCHHHMQLFLQLNMKEIPERQSEGLVQLFYCTNTDPLCEVAKEGYFPFSVNSVCRKISTDGASAEIKPDMVEIFPERAITAWKAVDDYPSFEEYSDLGIEIKADDELMEKLTPKAGDKLFGWPHWIQGEEYPEDRKTGNKMGLLFQIDSDDNLPFTFGDMGIGHLSVSPDDENEMAFGWACC